MIWDEKLSVGNSDIDEQHKWLIDFISNSREQSVEGVKKSLMELYRYTREHFVFEENHMKSIGYPKLEEHIEQHNQLLIKLTEFTEHSLLKGDTLQDFYTMLDTWIVSHVMKHDKAYAKFFQSKKTI